MRKAGEEEYRKKKTRDRGGWKRLSDEAVKKSVAGSTSPLTKGKEEEREIYVWMTSITRKHTTGV